MTVSQIQISTRNAFKTILSVYLLLIREKHVLLSKRAHTGYEDGKYGLVSGHVEANETLKEAMAREVAEEVGIILPIESINMVLTMHRFSTTSTPPERLDFFMCVEKWHGDPVNMEPAKCSELCWFETHNLPDNIIPYIRYALSEILAGNKYCGYGWTDHKN